MGVRREGGRGRRRENLTFLPFLAGLYRRPPLLLRRRDVEMVSTNDSIYSKNSPVHYGPLPPSLLPLLPPSLPSWSTPSSLFQP